MTKITKKIVAITAVLLWGGIMAAPVKSDLGADGAEVAEAWIPTAADYIQDGLIAMWDAIENGGPGVHDPTLNKNTWVEWCGTGWTFDLDRGGFFEDNWFGQTVARDKFDASVSDGLKQLTNGISTWEITVGETYRDEVGEREPLCGYFGVDGDGVNILRCITIYNPSTYELGSLESFRGLKVDPASWLHIVHKENRVDGFRDLMCHENGRLVATKRTTFRSNGTTTYIYCQPAYHKFHCMRLYNRLLSEKELQYNMLIDKIRFNLP